MKISSKYISSKYKVLSIVGLLFLFVYYTLYIIHYTLPFASAAGEPCILESDTSKAEATGLASAPITGSIKVNVAGQKICVENERAGFVSYKLPTYDDLKSLYFTQSKAAKTETTPAAGGYAAEDYISSSIAAGYNVINIKGDLRLHGDISAPAKPVIVFVDSNILINLSNSSYQFTYGNPNAGIVFIAKGNIDIDINVKRIDAVLIAEGAICTAFNGTNCPAGNVNSDPLLVNGSLISLSSNSANIIKFRRLLPDNTQPAEKIHYEPKYLVILKDLFADTYQKWSEIQ